ncbi:MAG: BrnA antitoxin family protein [Anaerolineae bacterium]|nr:BrnA antitoxin family protein [Anaerolineae bacterium]
MNPASSPCVKRQGARRSDASAKPKTDEPRPLDRSGKARCAAGHPAARIEAVVRGIVRRGLKPDACAVLISLRLDEDVFEWFKAQGPGYQARINAVWRAFRDASARGGCRHPSRPAPSPQSPALPAVTSPPRSHQPSPQAPALPADASHPRRRQPSPPTPAIPADTSPPRRQAAQPRRRSPVGVPERLRRA